jgi:hypothetical protein
MQNISEYREFLSSRGMTQEKINQYVESLEKADEYFKSMGKELLKAKVEDFRKYVSYLIESGENSYDELMPVGRYVYMMDMKEAWIYYAAILGGNTIYPSIRERLEDVAGKGICDSVFDKVDVPPLGSDPEEYPKATRQLMDQLAGELPPELYRKVLAGNHHKIPSEWFLKHKKWLEDLDGDIDAWLKKMHDSAVAELEEHLKEDKVWFEQVITQDIVDYVKNNQELLSGVREGEWIYNLKFPYAPQEYLDAEDDLMKRYYMCHCPLARSGILSGEQVPLDWCYCSAGYAKFRYDIVFGEETEVEVLESVLGGSDKCRFRILIPEKWR